MWAITFRQITGKGFRGVEEVFFRTEVDYNFKEEIYKWLDEIKE
jgi:hypothetical protein